jgi:hypothetical protein
VYFKDRMAVQVDSGYIDGGKGRGGGGGNSEGVWIKVDVSLEDC